MTNLPQNQAFNETIAASLNFADDIISKGYLQKLSFCEISELTQNDEDIANVIKTGRNSRFWKLSKLVLNQKEQLCEQLTTVMNVANTIDGSIVTVIKSENGLLNIILGVISKNNRGNNETDKEKALAILDAFDSSLSGNLPGSEFSKLTLDETIGIQNYLTNGNKSICAISGVPAFRDEKQSEILNFAQGIEHLIDSMRGENFTVISIADPLNHSEIEQIKQGYELIYSQLSSLLKIQITINESSSLSLSTAQTKSITDSITKGISLTQSKTKTDGKFSAFNAGMNFGVNFGVAAGVNFGSSVGTNSALSDSRGETKSMSEGTSLTKADTKSIGTTKSIGNSMQLSFENRSVKSLLDKTNKQIARLELCKSFGAFECATYILSNKRSVSLSAASNLNALMRAEESYVESSFINTWHDEKAVKKLTGFLGCFTHPKFNFSKQYQGISDSRLIFTPSSIMTGKEATLLLGLPRQSVCGVPVLEMTPFGRNVPPVTTENEINLGQLNHMGKSDKKNVVLDMQSLTAHTFITGSTGSGKSNTIYNLLNELGKKNVPFLVIEPVKGEYKHILGNRVDVSVFGTNPTKTPMLRINPFKFPNDIHVLEHIDRLIEIFNVCWPMYAAMPAVLKDAVECAYKACGWNLTASTNRYDLPLFPNFTDVLEWLQKVINQSEFSQELKSNYIGALVTRVKSLTNGINGQIFVCDEIDNAVLFDHNCIIDLSRVSSTETKAMLMGVLVMRLQEYRIAEGGMNKKLRHITVLEEAHNLLKRTGTEQSSESSNLLGKSVEMLSNAIAEMRTYGEGFLIADQSPNMLDLSVIRNTNTKIILRLPDLADRELSGRAASLNDEQIVELAKLPTGVAAVYQNNWLEPVLCHIQRFDSNFQEYCHRPQALQDTFKQDIIKCLLHTVANDNVEIDIDLLKERVITSQLSSEAKRNILSAMDSKRIDLTIVAPEIAGLFNVDDALIYSPKAKSIDEWNNSIIKSADFPFETMSEKYRDLVLFCIVSQRYEKTDTERLETWLKHMDGRLF